MKENKTQGIIDLIKKYEQELEDAKHDRDRFHIDEAYAAVALLQSIINDLQELISEKLRSNETKDS